jgi:hypothetical protein
MSSTIEAAMKSGKKIPTGLTNRTGISALASLAFASGIKDASPAGLQAYSTQITGMKLPTDLSPSGLADAVKSSSTGFAGVAGNIGLVAASGAANAVGIKLPEGAARQLAAAAAEEGITMPTVMSPAGILAAAAASGLTSGTYAEKLHAIAGNADIKMPADMSPAGLAAAAVESYHALPEGSHSQITAAAAAHGIKMPSDLSPSGFAAAATERGLTRAAFASALSTAAAAHGVKLPQKISLAIMGSGGAGMGAASY